MLSNYLKIALRSLLKNPVYSFINITGLSIGITCTILISLWVYDEVTYDRDQPKLDRLFQVWINADYNGQINSWTSLPVPTYEDLKTADSHIKNTAAMDWGGDHLMAVGEKSMVKHGYYASEEFLDMFQYPLLQGDASQVLKDASSIVLTESTAKAFFGEKDPINQVIRIDNKDDLKVSGVVADIPGNSSFQFDYLLPFKLFEQQEWMKTARTNWQDFAFPVFVELQSSEDEAAVETAIKPILNSKTTDNVNREFFLHPMDRWRLHSRFENGVESGGMADYVNAFAALAGFIILIACINFMNLATARSEKRAREVGIRKSIGSQRKELILQFLGESVMLATIAFVIALIFTEIMLPLYNNLVQKQLFIDYSSPWFWICSVSIILITGLLSGSYPAFFLSSFKAVKVLKGTIGAGRGGSTPRHILVTLQFIFSILGIIGVIGIYRQIQHVKAREVGYSQENLIYVDDTGDIQKNYQSIKQELISSGKVSGVTKSNSPITEIYSNNFLSWPGKPESEKVSFVTISSDYDYTSTLGIRIIQGRDFSPEFKSDSSAIIINEAALDIMGLTDPIGTELELWGGKRHVIGVIENTLMGSPFRDPSPAFVIYNPDWSNAVSIRLNPGDDIASSIASVESIFKKYNPAYPVAYHFADVEFKKKFTAINLIEKLTNIFASLAVIITGLGLFGLAAFTAEQRTKEIGIRKVLGASVSNLVLLMSRDFSKLVIIAFVVAAPFGWYMMEDYLSQYPYRATLPWWIIPIIGVAVFGLAFGIVATQALRAASNNPVQSLRSE